MTSFKHYDHNGQLLCSLLIAIKVMMGQKRVDCDDGATMLEVRRQFEKERGFLILNYATPELMECNLFLKLVNSLLIQDSIG